MVIGDVLDAEPIAEAIRTEGGRAAAVTLDVTSPVAWQQAVALAESQFAGLNGLVNNAGIVAYAGAADCGDEEWARIIAVNQTGVFHGIRAAIPALRRAEGGVIVNTASIFGLHGVENYFAYTASKAAVVGMTKSAAVTYAAEKIRVNAVAPGVIKTPMLEQELADLEGVAEADLLAGQPLQRLGESEDVAYAVVYLLSREASFVTGEVLTVDGGYSAR